MRLGAALVALALAVISATGAAAAPPTSFTTASGSCDEDETEFYTAAPVGADHDSAIAKFTTTLTLGEWSEPTFTSTPAVFFGADTLWNRVDDFFAGETREGKVDCYSAGSFSIIYYDTPEAPTSFAGRTTDSPNDLVEFDISELGFSAPGEAQYVADVILNSGALGINPSGPAASFDVVSSGRYPLGTLEAGEQTLLVQSLEGPSAVWQIDISALPVVLSAVEFDSPVLRPGEPTRLRYTTSGDTSVTVTIRNEQDAVVRTLADDFAVGHGPHSLPWNGRTQGGEDLPDGQYAALIETEDPSGATAGASAEIEIDSTAPNTRITAGPRKRARKHRVKFRFRADEPDVSFQCRLDRGTWRRCASPARGRVSKGRHRFQARAEDTAGNLEARPASYRFRVRG